MMRLSANGTGEMATSCSSSATSGSSSALSSLFVLALGGRGGRDSCDSSWDGVRPGTWVGLEEQAFTPSR